MSVHNFTPSFHHGRLEGRWGWRYKGGGVNKGVEEGVKQGWGWEKKERGGEGRGGAKERG